ncbi:hypothetical protein [Prauserella cavernicola]|uniref:DUF485 domain-containing protein n=1 Tax=Prauserella cavernicola TaxID=2800127 RepID=A0A934V3J9_9PSEU|nr:hypothetical protein [Prauserella cavernicola]MBK1784437.1 hypothetical protein [Prauserella cavernicola]
MTDEFYPSVDGIRAPDPTLGKSVQPEPPVEPVAEVAEPEPPPRIRRQRVVLAEPSRSSGSLRARVELEQQTSWGELLIKDLIKIQLRSGLALAALVVALLGSLPAVFFLWPGFTELNFVGIPLAWLLLAVAPFPLLFGVGLWYNRLAERHERDFVDMIEN